MKTICVINSISILDDRSAILKSTDGRCYLVELTDSSHCWKEDAFDSFQEYLSISELVLWANDTLSEFKVSLKIEGKMSSVFTSEYQKITEVKPAQALTLLLKAGKIDNG